MSTEEEEAALLAAVVAELDDDAPRLAYADWLDEHAESVPGRDAAEMRDRAEFIRVQHEKAVLDTWDFEAPAAEVAALRDRWRLLRDREAALRTARQGDWRWVGPCGACDGTPSEPGTGRFCMSCSGTGDRGGLRGRMLSSTGGRVWHPFVTFRSGFLDAVVVGAWYEILERCAVCGGRGYVNVGPGLPQRCTACSELWGWRHDWRPTAWARRVVREHPTLQRFVLNCWKPFWSRSGHEWYRATGHPGLNRFNSQAYLPTALFDALRGGTPCADGGRAYHDIQAATDAVAVAACTVTRQWREEEPQ